MKPATWSASPSPTAADLVPRLWPGAPKTTAPGIVATVGDGLDYSVIRFDPAKVTPTASFASFAINGIGADPSFREPVCTQCAATANDYGRILSISGPGPRCSFSAPFQPGDDGRPVTADGRLIGLT